MNRKRVPSVLARARKGYEANIKDILGDDYVPIDGQEAIQHDDSTESEDDVSSSCSSDDRLPLDQPQSSTGRHKTAAERKWFPPTNPTGEFKAICGPTEVRCFGSFKAKLQHPEIFPKNSTNESVLFFIDCLAYSRCRTWTTIWTSVICGRFR